MIFRKWNTVSPFQEKVIERRYSTGIVNLFDIYIPICDYWMLFNNSETPSELIAEGYAENEMSVKNIRAFEVIKDLSNDK